VGNKINNLRQILGSSLADGDLWRLILWSPQEGMRLLGDLAGATYFAPTGINDAGAITGFVYTSTKTFSFYKGPGLGWTSLKGLGGAAYAQAINQQGVIAGSSYDSTDLDHAVIWSSPTVAPQDLGLGAAHGLNNVGQVVGEAYFP
jgi:uncharacterized membrane protein